MTWRKREIMEMARQVGYPIQHEEWRKATEEFAALVREEQQPEVQRLIALVRAQQITIDKLEAALSQPAPVQEPSVLIPASLAEKQFERYYRQGYDAGFAAQPEQEFVAKVTVNTHGAFCTEVKIGELPHGEYFLCTTPPQRTWVDLIRGVRVEGDTVVITVKGGNDEARCLCGELINEMELNT